MSWGRAAIAIAGAVLLGASTWYPWERAPADANFIFVEASAWFWFTPLDFVVGGLALACAAVAAAAATRPGIPGRRVLGGLSLVAGAVVVYRVGATLTAESTQRTVGFGGPDSLETLDVPSPGLASGAALAAGGVLLLLTAAVLAGREREIAARGP